MISSRNPTVAVVAPAGIPKTDGLDAGLDLLRAWGYQVVEGRFVRDRHLFNAGTAADRAADLLWALTAPGIDAVWLARGGYGTVHCLPFLDGRTMVDRPIVGSSDATALFSALALRGHRNLIHGPMVATLAGGVDDDTRDRIRAILAGRSVGPIPGRRLCGPKMLVEGAVVGGNLCVLASLAGTRWAAKTAGSIVVLEDINEPAYRIDRAIQQLRWSGMLEAVRGIALGDFVGCGVPASAFYSLHDVLIEALAPCGVPVVMGLPIGHSSKNLAWRYGGQGRLLEDGLAIDCGLSSQNVGES